MSPSPRAVGLAVVGALLLLVLPWGLVGALGLVGAVALVVDALAARRPVTVRRDVPARLARGVAERLVIEVLDVEGRSVEVRQPHPPDLAVVPSVAPDRLEAWVTAARRGRHEFAPVAVRVTGPLGLGRWDHAVGGPVAVEVVPDLPAARRLAVAVRQGRFRDPGLTRRGALGLGTAFEQVRDYQPDDDVRHINWVATARQGRPMANQYREETERDVLLLVDAGRLMGAPLDDGAPVRRTRLDVAVDVAVAVAAVADVVGDRCGLVAFDDEVRARVRPGRARGDAVARALFALEPSPAESDPEGAFRRAGLTKRALLVVLTDLLDVAAGEALLDAVPVLARHHEVVVASVADSSLAALAGGDDLRALVATGVERAHDELVALLARRRATVVEAPADALAAAVVARYLDAKAAARL